MHFTLSIGLLGQEWVGEESYNNATDETCKHFLNVICPILILINCKNTLKNKTICTIRNKHINVIFLDTSQSFGTQVKIPTRHVLYSYTVVYWSEYLHFNLHLAATKILYKRLQGSINKSTL